MCLCLWLRSCVCVNGCVYIRVSVIAFACVFAFVIVIVCVCVCVCFVSVFVFALAFAFVFVFVCARACARVYVLVCQRSTRCDNVWLAGSHFYLVASGPIGSMYMCPPPAALYAAAVELGILPPLSVSEAPEIAPAHIRPGPAASGCCCCLQMLVALLSCAASAAWRSDATSHTVAFVSS